MIFENLIIARVIIHQVFKRLDDRQIVSPRYGTALTVLGNEDGSALQDRIIAALGSASKCMEMRIVDTAEGSMFALAQTLVDCDEALFINQSARVADILAQAQTRQRIPGGIVVVWSGSVGYPAKRVIGAIKAEPHSGFTFREEGGITLEFLRNLVLTPEARLYKIGVFIEMASAAIDTAGWKAFVYDDLMTAANRETAAQYFYETFLGCNIPLNSARQTKKFFDLTRGFIDKLELPEHEKVDLHTGLFTYLKVDQSPTIDTATFASRFLREPEMRDAYVNFMSHNQFPTSAVNKDISDLKSQLKRRKIVFGSDIQLSAPAESFAELVTVEPITGDAQPDGSASEWTRITVRDRIRIQQ